MVDREIRYLVFYINSHLIEQKKRLNRSFYK